VWAVFGCGGVCWPEGQNLPPQPIAENDCECKMTAEYDCPESFQIGSFFLTVCEPKMALKRKTFRWLSQAAMHAWIRHHLIYTVVFPSTTSGCRYPLSGRLDETGLRRHSVADVQHPYQGME
jgi:hypothetical protein